MYLGVHVRALVEVDEEEGVHALGVVSHSGNGLRGRRVRAEVWRQQREGICEGGGVVGATGEFRRKEGRKRAGTEENQGDAIWGEERTKEQSRNDKRDGE